MAWKVQRVERVCAVNGVGLLREEQRDEAVRRPRAATCARPILASRVANGWSHTCSASGWHGHLIRSESVGNLVRPIGPPSKPSTRDSIINVHQR
jgi:hypothetical protein